MPLGYSTDPDRSDRQTGIGLEVVRRAIADGHDVPIIVQSRDRVSQMGDLASRIRQVFVAELSRASDRVRVRVRVRRDHGSVADA